MIENKNEIPDFKQIDLKDFDCFFIEYKDHMRPIFYIKLEKLLNLFDLYQQEKHKIFEQVLENENKDEMYVLKINEEGLPFIPIQKDILQQMICEGDLLNNISNNMENFVDKHKEKHSHITNEYMKNIMNILNNELKKMEFDLKQYQILQQIYTKNIDCKNSDSSENIDSSDSSISDTSITNTDDN